MGLELYTDNFIQVLFYITIYIVRESIHVEQFKVINQNISVDYSSQKSFERISGF